MNEFVSYQDHCFNHLFQFSIILIHHIDDIASYLDIYPNIVNGISISDRSFAEMTFLKPVFCAVALVGLHISNIITLPFQALLAANETNYSTLLSAFPILYDELKSVNPERLCTTKDQVFHFVPKTTFDNLVKNTRDVILLSITSTIPEYKSEIISLLKMILPKLADGFSTQREQIFGFGLEADSECLTFKDLLCKYRRIAKVRHNSYTQSWRREKCQTFKDIGGSRVKNL